MKLLPLAVLGLSALAFAQTSPLVVVPVTTGGVGSGYYGFNTPPPAGQIFFDLNVLAPQLTLQAIATPILSPVGQIGQLEVWMTNPGITTHIGNELIAGNWTKVASGQIVGNGTSGSIANTLTRISCETAIGGGGLVLSPGSRGVALRYTGVNPLLCSAVAGQTFSNPEMSVSNGALQYTAWGATSAVTGAGNIWCWRGSLFYQPGVFPHACAVATNYGTGCNTVNGSFYQVFTNAGSAAAASAALQGRSLNLVNTGTGYIVLPGTATYIAPTVAATALTLADDGEAQVTLPVPFVYPGGVATDLWVHANGIVSVASNSAIVGPTIPTAQSLLSAPATAWFSWHQFNPAEAGSGQVKWELVGNLFCVTWDGVESYPATPNPSTMQFQFDVTTGDVKYVWQTIDALGNSGFLYWDDTAIGFSPGTASPNTGNINITTLSSLTLTVPEALPLQLDTSAKPLIGSTISLNTTRETGLGVGVNFVTTGNFPAPGIDLAVIGAPGCPALVDINTGVGNVISNLGLPGLSMSIPFTLPNNPVFAGLSVYSQSVWLDPTANAFGALTSNGIEMLLGNF